MVAFNTQVVGVTRAGRQAEYDAEHTVNQGKIKNTLGNAPHLLAAQLRANRGAVR
jgi:hypothetical protein